MGEFVATHDYDPAGSPGCIALSAGDRVIVTDSTREDWWIGYRAADQSNTGSFPKAFVAAAPARAPARPLQPETQPVVTGSFIAAHDYDPGGSKGCIALVAGDSVTVTDGSREDWWVGYKDSDPSTVGSFPKAYVLPSSCTTPGSTCTQPCAECSSDGAPAMPPRTPSSSLRELAVDIDDEMRQSPTAQMVLMIEQVAAAAKTMLVARAEPSSIESTELVRLVVMAALDQVTGTVAATAVTTAAARPALTTEEGVPPDTAPASLHSLQLTTSSEAAPEKPPQPRLSQTLPRLARGSTLPATLSPLHADLTRGSTISVTPSPRLPTDLQCHIQKFSADNACTIHFKRRRTKGFLGIFGRRLLTVSDSKPC